MTASTTGDLISGAITSFGGEALVLLGGVLGIGVGLLVFYFGWRKVRGVAK